MSFLSDMINLVRSHLEPRPRDLGTALATFKNAICKILQEANNLRVFDGEFGGAVRGPKQNRRKRYENEAGYLLCQEAYIDKGSLEVPYFRAMFNSPGRTLPLAIVPPLQIRLIGYESPLMRRSDNQNPEINSRAVSCDLFGLASDNRIWCIEGKVKPENRNTDIVYGLLEAFAYGVCVQFYLSDDIHRINFNDEVRACMKEFHGEHDDVPAEPLTAAFSLAAPKEYFGAYFSPRPKFKENAKNLLDEARHLLAEFEKMTDGPAWAGFLVVEPTCHETSFERKGLITRKQRVTRNGIKVEEDLKICEPHFLSGSLRVALALDIDALNQSVGNLPPRAN